MSTNATNPVESGAAAMQLRLNQFPEKCAVVRLGPGAEIPKWAESSSIFSVTATATETSVICASRSVPTKTPSVRPLTAFAVQGPLDPEASGVLHALLTPLVEEGISVFTISTFDTDWILVPLTKADDAAQAWRRRGHTVAAAVPVDPSRKSKK
ncbi:MAG: ACT domain-containing protein [Nocardioides sp.]|nr:ACT domain-containing protein [Nocardioides sp.]